ncbi:MAG: tyrosine-type recombinase/integrase [Bacteroidota bacterium]
MFISKDANGYYYLYFEGSNGKRQRISTKTKLKSKALEFYKSFETDKQTPTQKRLTLKEFILSYEPYVNSNFSPATASLHLIFLNQFMAFIGDRYLHTISPLQTDQFKTHCLGLEHPNRLQTINIKLTKLKTIFNTAQRWNLIENNPFEETKLFTIPEEDVPYFTPEDFSLFLAANKCRDFEAFCMIGFFTGMRLSEIASLQWSDIDLEGKVIRIRSKEGFTVKNKRNRSIPLSDVIVFLLRKRKIDIKDNCPFLFHHSGKKYTKDFVTKKFKRIIKRTTLTQSLHFHSLRHSFCSNLVKNGVSLYQVQKLAGHSKASVTQKYSHLIAQEMHDVVNILSIR